MITHDVDEAVLLSDQIVMMTNGPAATVGEILPINLERPRDRVKMSETPEYIHCRHEVLSFLYERQSRKAVPVSKKDVAKDVKRRNGLFSLVKKNAA
jgi:nitrate/nitrite transport system ATP-binding protein